MTNRQHPPVKKSPVITAIIIISIVLGVPLLGLYFMIMIASTFISSFADIKVDDGSKINQNSMLVIDMARSIPDRPDDRDPGKIFGDFLYGNDIQGSPYLRQVINAIHKAEIDERIKGIVIYTPKNGYIASSLANVQEVREALKMFSKSSHKPIIAYLRNNGLKSYYLASVSDEIYMHPMGLMLITGYSADPLYMKSALDKLGIGVQVARVGEYKSAVEPFISNEISPENNEQIGAYLNGIWNQVIEDIADDRKLNKQDFNLIANTMGFVQPEDALKMGLVDKLAFEEDFSEHIAETAPNLEDPYDFEGVNINDYIVKTTPLKSTHTTGEENKVAVLYVEGEIVDNYGGAGSETLKQLCADIRGDESIKAIVLRIDSPGGSAVASEDILHSLKKAVGDRPVVVSMGGLAASGGYYITANSDRIIANRATLTGSIGVFGLFFNGEETMDLLGLSPQFIDTHNFSSVMNPLRKKTPQEMVVLKEHIKGVYDIFINHVSDSRKMSYEDVDKIARGHVWLGDKAVELGLVDAIGGLETSIEEAANIANIKDYRVVDFPREDEMVIKMKRILGNVSIKVPENIATRLLKTASKPLEDLNSYTDPQGVYMRLPFNINEEE